MTKYRAPRAGGGDGAYGETLARSFGVEDAPAIVTRTLPRAQIGVTEIRVDNPTSTISESVPHEDAYLVALSLMDIPMAIYWDDGRQAPIRSVRAGDTTLHDLRRRPSVLIDTPRHSLLFYLPRATLDAIAVASNAPRIDELRYEPNLGMRDDTLRHLGMSLLPALRTPEQVNRLFLDHVTLAVATHVAQTYGGLQTVPGPVRGGLAPWQEKRAKEMLAADLTGATPLSAIAKACGLSTSHFSRAFRRSTGHAPHAWLLNLRVETAKALLRQHQMPLHTIALACGFADQSHFTRVFSRLVGESPGAWRRSVSD
jgi:AraC family transcriptional regulator